MVKNPPANAGNVGLIPEWEDPQEKEVATHSSILAWYSMEVYSQWVTKELDMT